MAIQVFRGGGVQRFIQNLINPNAAVDFGILESATSGTKKNNEFGLFGPIFSVLFLMRGQQAGETLAILKLNHSSVGSTESCGLLSAAGLIREKFGPMRRKIVKGWYFKGWVCGVIPSSGFMAGAVNRPVGRLDPPP